MKYDYINKENNVPKILITLDSFFSKFPAFNTIFGMCLYSTIIYLLLLLIRIYCRKPDYDEDDFDLFDKEEKNELIELKKRREKLFIYISIQNKLFVLSKVKTLLFFL